MQYKLSGGLRIPSYIMPLCGVGDMRRPEQASAHCPNRRCPGADNGHRGRRPSRWSSGNQLPSNPGHHDPGQWRVDCRDLGLQGECPLAESGPLTKGDSHLGRRIGSEGNKSTTRSQPMGTARVQPREIAYEA